MEIFQKASVVRLGSHHDKYLFADDNQETVSQDRNGSSVNTRWVVEFSDSSSDHIRLKSCYGKYLTASNMPSSFGMRGKKVVQSLPSRLTSSVEWEPIREGVQVRFRTHYGQFLRANPKFRPWKGHITHDVSHRSVTQDWILWDVEVLEYRQDEDLSCISSPPVLPLDTSPWPSPYPPMDTPPWPSPQPPVNEDDVNSSSDDPDSPSEFSLRGPKVSNLESDEDSPAAFEGRAIKYEVLDKNGDVNKKIGVRSLSFNGSGVEELIKTLKVEAGVKEEVIVCSRNPLNGKLYPLRLHLPPNNAAMHVVLVPRSSKAAKGLGNH